MQLVVAGHQVLLGQDAVKLEYEKLEQARVPDLTLIPTLDKLPGQVDELRPGELRYCVSEAVAFG